MDSKLTGVQAIAPDETTTLMTREEAEASCDRISGHLNAARQEIEALDRREGWRALGYESFRECAVARFGHHQSYIYRQLSAARIEESMGLPIGEMSESHARALSKIEPDRRQEVLDSAKEATGGKVTAKAIAIAAQPEPEHDFNVGDVVRLATGSNRGTVQTIHVGGDLSIAFNSSDPPIRTHYSDIVLVRRKMRFGSAEIIEAPHGTGVFVGDMGDGMVEVVIHDGRSLQLTDTVDRY